MSQENGEIVRAAIWGVNRGDWDAAFADAAPTFEWDNSRAIGTDNRVVLSGASEARRFFEKLSEV